MKGALAVLLLLALLVGYVVLVLTGPVDPGRYGGPLLGILGVLGLVLAVGVSGVQLRGKGPKDPD